MSDARTARAAFVFGGIVAAFLIGIANAIAMPYHTGYCTAACGPAGVVDVTQKVCTCGPESAPVAVRIGGGE